MFERTRNIIRWIPIIWKDRQWDHYYFFKIMKFKLENMEKYFRYGDTHVVKSNDIADEIKRSILVINRILKDDYTEYDRHDKKWGDMEFIFEKDGRLNINRLNVLNEKDKEQERKEFLRCSKHGEMLRKQDMEYLFKWIKKHVKTWWD